MKINRIEFRGYKAFNGSDVNSQFQAFDLAPLTLVFGKNNSGKSAVVRLPRLILGGLECNDGRVLPSEVRGLSFGTNFLELVHGGAFFTRPSFHVVGEHDRRQLDLNVTLFSRDAFAADEPPQVWSYDMKKPRAISTTSPALGGDAPRFLGLLPEGDEWDKWRKAAKTVLDRMVHIGPTRAKILPAYSNDAFSAFGLDGAGAPQALRVDGELADLVADWYETNMDGWRLMLKRDSESFSVRLSKSRTLSTNLSQAGEGLQQVLPVVAHQFWRQRTAGGPFLDVIEQPELHLHAAAQAPLADLFVATALGRRGQLLVETNSEPILLRIQRRVAEGGIDPSLVAIYFVEMSELGSQLRKIDLHEDGELEWWPEGVFEEDFTEVAAIRRAQRQTASRS